MYDSQFYKDCCAYVCAYVALLVVVDIGEYATFQLP